jgi:hypothetical protein
MPVRQLCATKAIGAAYCGMLGRQLRAPTAIAAAFRGMLGGLLRQPVANPRTLHGLACGAWPLSPHDQGPTGDRTTAIAAAIRGMPGHSLHPLSIPLSRRWQSLDASASIG